MSLSLVQSRALVGLQAPAVTVEVHLANGLPSFTIIDTISTYRNPPLNFPRHEATRYLLSTHLNPKTDAWFWDKSPT